MTARIACAFFMDSIERVAAARRAFWLVFDVAVCAKEIIVSRGGVIRLRSFNYPTHFGGINALAIGAAYLLPRLIDCIPQVRDRNTRQESDDGHHDHDFNKGETVLNCSLHILDLVCVPGCHEVRRLTMVAATLEN